MVATPPGNIYISLVFDLFQIYCSVWTDIANLSQRNLIFSFSCLILSPSLSLSVFDDGDERTLKRSSLCLKGGRHFDKSEVGHQSLLLNILSREDTAALVPSTFYLICVFL
jgi:hypothetical protein